MIGQPQECPAEAFDSMGQSRLKEENFGNILHSLAARWWEGLGNVAWAQARRGMFLNVEWFVPYPNQTVFLSEDQWSLGKVVLP